MALDSAHPVPNHDSGDSETTGSHGPREVRWVVVAETFGMMPADIMVGRLQTEGIPARAWQEGAGSALGLTIGALGTAHVVVPEEYAEQAREILALGEELELTDEDEEE